MRHHNIRVTLDAWTSAQSSRHAVTPDSSGVTRTGSPTPAGPVHHG